MRVHRIEFTSTTTWKAPPGVHYVRVTGCGGGGGGGGSSTTVPVNHYISGGGGGGGSILSSYDIEVVPNTTYDIAIGAGGAGGALFTDGSPGGSTEFSVGGFSLALMPGAQGGYAPKMTNVPMYWAYYALGGGPVAGSSLPVFIGDVATAIGNICYNMNGNDFNITFMGGTPINVLTFPQIPGAGGASALSSDNSGVGGALPLVSRAGMTNPSGFAGGTAGAAGADSGTSRGGGGGGGGGGGPFGPGGQGGAGGNGLAFPGAVGGAPPTANSGAGGGGAGSGGVGGAAAVGGAGSAGRLILSYFY